MRHISFLLIAFYFFSCGDKNNEEPLPEEPAIWKQLNDFEGLPRSGGIAFTLFGKGYYGMGGNWEEPFMRDLWMYEPSTDAWEQMNDFPFDLPAEIALVTENNAYVITYSGSLYKYYPTEDLWEYISVFPPGNRPGITGFAIGEDLYYMTGNSVTSPISFYNDVWKFETVSKKWTKLTDFPGVVRSNANAFVVGDRAFVGFGFDDYAPPINQDFWEYQPATDNWVQKKDMPVSDRIVGITFSSSSKAYVGLPDNTEFLQRALIYEFDPTKNSWRMVTSFPSINSVETNSFTINERMFVVGGFWSTHNREVWEFIP